MGEGEIAVSGVGLIIFLLIVLLSGLGIYITVLLIRALKKYINSKEIRQEKSNTQKTIGEILKQNRIERNLTQEYVAECMGVSRQAVSKWESGKSDPSTSNLLALAKLYQIPIEELLKDLK